MTRNGWYTMKPNQTKCSINFVFYDDVNNMNFNF